MSEESFTRIAVVNVEKCKPSKCKLECKKKCPVNSHGKMCIDVNKDSKIASISEVLCIGCNQCVKVCPFHAIDIVQIPKELSSDCIFRYSANGFKLHRLPIMVKNSVIGLVGKNGIGKSTAFKILAGKIMPNLGRYHEDEAPDWPELIKYYRGTRLQPFFTSMSKGEIKAILKPQHIDKIGQNKSIKGRVIDLLNENNECGKVDELIDKLDLKPLLSRFVDVASDGELQRLCIAIAANKKADAYMFDEPSSFLDIRQRLNAASVIRSLARDDKYVVVAEHDLCLLDYLSDQVCILFGHPGTYGVVAGAMNVRDGINAYLAGYIRNENLRFRPFELSFENRTIADTKDIDSGDLKEAIEFKEEPMYRYPAMSKTFDGFKLTIEAGSFKNSQITVFAGENGCGKTTFINMIAGLLKPDGKETEIPEMKVSLKPQKISPKFTGTVRELLHLKISGKYTDPLFVSDVIKPLGIDKMFDNKVGDLSGGMLQVVAITLALGKPADLYLLDEPSAYLDCEMRLAVSKAIKRFILHYKKCAFIVEHDMLMSTYLADQMIVFSGKPGVDTVAHSPLPMVAGMNQFLKQLDITFRRDTRSHRPRINKLNSVKDVAQKKAGTYFYVDDIDDVHVIDNDDDDEDDSNKYENV